jgi:molybdenum cofactor cytidylyltransferase
MNVGVIILAAGESSRMGFPKQVLPIFGTSMIKHLVHEVLDTPYFPLTVVVGAHKDKIVPELKDIPLSIIDNPTWREGMGGSVKMGLVGTYLASKDIDAVLVMTSDMPHVNAALLRQMVKTAEQHPNKSIVAAAYSKTIGVPVLFKRARFEDILNLKPHEAPKIILQNYKEEVVSVPFELGSVDLDTKQSYFDFVQSKN